MPAATRILTALTRHLVRPRARRWARDLTRTCVEALSPRGRAYLREALRELEQRERLEELASLEALYRQGERVRRDPRALSRWLRAHGYREMEIHFDALLEAILEDHPREVLLEGGRLERFELGPDLTLLRRGGRPTAWMYHEEVERTQIQEAIRALVWRDRDLLELDRVGRRELSIRPAPEPSSYLGPLLALLPRWARCMKAGLPRRVLLRGPRGSGKSTFARHTARELGGRALILTSDALGWVSPRQWSELLEWLRPDLVLLEDPDQGRGQFDDVPDLRARGEEGFELPLLLVTSSSEEARYGRHGEVLASPEAVDEIYEVLAPDGEHLEALLDLLAEQERAEVPEGRREQLREIATERSLAHAREMLRRARVHGWDDLTAEGDVTFGSGDDFTDPDELPF